MAVLVLSLGIRKLGPIYLIGLVNGIGGLESMSLVDEVVVVGNP